MKLTPEQKQMAVNLHAQGKGLSYPQIAEAFGCDPETIRRAIDPNYDAENRRANNRKARARRTRRRAA